MSTAIQKAIRELIQRADYLLEKEKDAARKMIELNTNMQSYRIEFEALRKSIAELEGQRDTSPDESSEQAYHTNKIPRATLVRQLNREYECTTRLTSVLHNATDTNNPTLGDVWDIPHEKLKRLPCCGPATLREWREFKDDNVLI